ncbi:MAG: rhodanese-like domain-containing protein [Candidatus Korobacteraceae bacterium]
MKFNLTVTGKMLAALGLVLLAIILAVTATMARGGGAGPVNDAALVQSIVAETDHVTPVELAQWIIEKKQDYQLIDIRQPWQYDDYHIPTAVNVPLSQFFQEGNLKQLDRGKKIVVYGLGAGHAAETQLLLSIKGYNAFSLREGISAWWDQVITPTSLRSESASPEGYQQARQLRDYFMGNSPSTNKSVIVPSTAAPVVLPPAGQPEQKQQEKKLKIGKGCS